jgi:hypothetical protein
MSDDSFTPTHRGEIRSTEHNLPMGQRTTIGLRSTANAWVDKDGVRYDKVTGQPIGDGPPGWILRLTSVKRMASVYKTTAAQSKPAPAPKPQQEPPVAERRSPKTTAKPAPEPPVAAARKPAKVKAKAEIKLGPVEPTEHEVEVDQAPE